MRTTLLVLASLTLAVHGWQDCDTSSISSWGPFRHSLDTSYTYQGHPVYIAYPNASLPRGADSWPIVVFMHGMTLSWEWYAANVQQWSSHGFVVAAPYVKSADKDDSIIPVTETDSNSIYAAYGLLNGMANGTIQPPKDLAGAIDVQNLAIVGHSMGGEDTIRAAAGVRVPSGFPPLPAGALKVAIAQHPSLCTFPPPYPYTINKAEVNKASLNGALFLMTSENDRAFLPGTPTTEHSCWQAATGPAIFANFKKSACEGYPACKDLIGAPGCETKRAFCGVGHLCACAAPGLDTWVSPELKWVTATLRLYLHHGNSSVSSCSALVWGSGTGSLRQDPNVAHVEAHGPIVPLAPAGTRIVV